MNNCMNERYFTKSISFDPLEISIIIPMWQMGHWIRTDCLASEVTKQFVAGQLQLQSPFDFKGMIEISIFNAGSDHLIIFFILFVIVIVFKLCSRWARLAWNIIFIIKAQACNNAVTPMTTFRIARV